MKKLLYIYEEFRATVPPELQDDFKLDFSPEHLENFEFKYLKHVVNDLNSEDTLSSEK